MWLLLAPPTSLLPYNLCVSQRAGKDREEKGNKELISQAIHPELPRAQKMGWKVVGLYEVGVHSLHPLHSVESVGGGIPPSLGSERPACSREQMRFNVHTPLLQMIHFV